MFPTRKSIARAVAKTWAEKNAVSHRDPVEFGHHAIRVYLAALQTLTHAGDVKATEAALAALDDASPEGVAARKGP